jgi:phage terminase small subunit
LGSRLLNNVDVRRQIDDLRAAYVAKAAVDAGITIDRTLREIARVAYFDPRKLFDRNGQPLALVDLDDDTAAAIAGLDVLEEFEGMGKDRRMVGMVKKWKLADKLGALDKLMKHLGGYKEDNDQTKPQGVAEGVAAFLGQLHQSGAGRMPFTPRAKP